MVEIVAVSFIVCVFGLLMAFFFGSIGMNKVIGIFGIVIGLVAFVVFIFWLSITLFVLAWNLSVAAYFGLAALTFWKGFGFTVVGASLFKGKNVIEAVVGLCQKRRR